MPPSKDLRFILNVLFVKKEASHKCGLFSFQSSKTLIIFIFFVYIGIPNFVSAQNTNPTVNTISNTFTLNQSANTSAGVYTTNNTLVRTLWSLVTYQPGTYTINWDGKDDNGNQMTAGNYTVKVVSNNINYTWEGVIGNNSTADTGSAVHRYYGTIACMTEVGNYMYYGTSFCEQDAAQWKLLKSAPLQKIRIFPNGGTTQQSLFNCANGNNVFWAGRDYLRTDNFVIATAVSNDALTTFSSGVAYTSTGGPIRNYPSVLDLNTLSAPGLATGMAVQQTGNQYLFVSHASQNYINVYNTASNTGNLVQTISITNPGNLFLENDNTLWVSQGTTLTKYTVNSDGTITITGSQITGFSNIVGLSIHSGDLCVLDAGNQQVVKRFNSTTLASTGTIGQIGGYASSPAVANNKFYLSDIRSSGIASYYTSFIAHQSDGSIWVGDVGNYRYQHFNSSGNYLNNIMCLPNIYNVNVCLNQNTAIFGDFLEYTIDYTQPISSGWTLTNNWGYNQPTGWNTNQPIVSVIKMSNGRRYAMFEQNSTTYYWGELTASGVRYNLVNIPGYKSQTDSLGNLYFWSGTGTYPNQIYTYNKYTLTGFDGSNNPAYSPFSTIIASVPLGANSAVSSTAAFNLTTSGNLVLFNNNILTKGGGANRLFHLSGFNLANNQMAWKTCPETFTAYSGDYPRDGAFDIGNLVQQPGNECNSIGNNIFFGYHGEFWKNSETGMIYHYNDQGLLLGLWGVLGPDVVSAEAAQGYASNTLNLKPTKVGGNIYIYANDESKHSGIHRWKITGLNTINEQDVPFQLSNLLTPAALLSGTDLLAGLPDLDTVANGTSGWNRDHNEDYTSLSSKYFTVTSGYNSYLPSTVDLYVHYRQPVGTYTVTRALGNNIGLNNWNLSGQLSLIRNHPNETNGSGGMYIEILDNNGKIITRLYETYAPTPGLYTFYINANDKILMQNTQPALTVIAQSARPFAISAANGAITFNYAGNSVTTSNLIDPTANWKNPTTLRLYFWTNTNGVSNDRFVDFPVLGFTANLAPQTINFPSIPAMTSGNPAFPLVALSSSNLPVTFSVISGPASISGNTITLTGAGTVVVQASQAGNFFYSAAPSVTQTFVVNLRTDL